MVARLVAEGQGPEIVVDKAIVLIGRHPECDAVLEDNRKVSRRHCCLAIVNDQLVIRDLGSMNGVQVNGEQVVEAVLQNGDVVHIGDEEFHVDIRKSADKRSPGPRQAEAPAARPAPVSRPQPAAPRRMPAPADLSQEFPVVIPEDEGPEESLNNAITPRKEMPFLVDVPDMIPDEHLLQLDSGEINLSEIDSDSSSH